MAEAYGSHKPSPRLAAVDRDRLRALQAPLKERYRDDPGAARLTLRSEGTLGQEEIACRVETAKGLVAAGLHPATGGNGALACSGDMLLDALVACAGVTLTSVATALGIEVAGTVRAEGELDFRGTLGVVKDAQVGFERIRLSFALEHSADEAQLAKLIELTERYCVVYQTLSGGVPVEVEYS
jgi:uncharacterized OsmC-like protein